jgi:hypothetical protein
MGEVQHLEKDKPVTFGNTNYKAISEAHVTTVVRKAMIDAHLVMFPVSQTMNAREMIKDGIRTGYLTEGNIEYKLCDTETGYSEIVSSSGQGVDSQDKGSGKAMTYAYKYALIRTFMIPSGEDPDYIASEEEDYNEEKIVAKAKKNKKEETPVLTEKDPMEYMEEKFETKGEAPCEFLQDAEIVELLKVAYAKTPKVGNDMVASFKGSRETLLTILKRKAGQ